MSLSSIQPLEATSCPDDEGLLAHLIAEVPALEGPRARHRTRPAAAQPTSVGSHLLACDACVARSQAVRSRLRLAAEVEAPVPAAVAGRTARPAAALRPASRSVRPERGWRRLQRSLRLPLLLPMAAAATFMVYTGVPDRPIVSEPEVRTRDVGLRQPARTTAPQAALFTAPTASATTAARIDRGTTVFLLAEQPGWYRVELGDGTPGWMEKGAFE